MIPNRMGFNAGEMGTPWGQSFAPGMSGVPGQIGSMAVPGQAPMPGGMPTHVDGVPQGMMPGQQAPMPGMHPGMGAGPAPGVTAVQPQHPNIMRGYR